MMYLYNVSVWVYNIYLCFSTNTMSLVDQHRLYNLCYES